MMNLRRMTLPAMDFSGLKDRINWVKLGKWFTIVLLIVAGVMVAKYAHSMDWNGVIKALRAYPASEIAMASVLTIASFLVYSTFDLFGRHYTNHAVPTWRVMSLTSISYAFNLTLGSILGAAGIRLRLYQQRGISAGDVGRIILISVGVNWLGYAAVAGVLFALNLITLPAAWGVGAHTLPLIGWALMAVVVAYIGTTVFFGDRKFTVRGREVCLPKTPAALAQIALGASNWILMGAVLFCLLHERIAFPLTLAIVMVASVAGIISRIPGGIGVLEAVSIAILSPQMSETKVLAAVLAYRAIYYIAPLLLATCGLLALEAMDKKRSGEQATA
jgi:uncharacterized membrane protein YbhN (UPF0104 family)